jgi:hypothetical protein
MARGRRADRKFLWALALRRRNGLRKPHAQELADDLATDSVWAGQASEHRVSLAATWIRYARIIG